MSTAVSARAQRAQRRAAQSAPQPRRPPSREILSEHSSDDRYSEYEPTDATEDSITFTATATSRMRSEAQMTLSAAFLATRELINNEPHTSLHDAWIAQIAELLNIAYPVIEQSAARPPPGAQPPPRSHQRPPQACPRDQGAARRPVAVSRGLGLR